MKQQKKQQRTLFIGKTLHCVTRRM